VILVAAVAVIVIGVRQDSRSLRPEAT